MRRVVHLVVGLVLFGVADGLLVRGAIGLAPWDVLAQGVSGRTGIGYGWVTNAIGALVLLLWIPLRQRPGVGTVLNVLLVGTSAQLCLWLVPEPGPLWGRVAVFAAGLVLMAVATGLYIGAQLGPGPRDGLMTGLVARAGLHVWVARTVVEASVLGLGWWLGGTVGVGTVAFTVLIGPLCQPCLRWFALNRDGSWARPPAAQAPAAKAVSAPVR